MRAERLSKIAVALWAVAAVLIEFYYASPGWPALRTLGPLILAGFALLSVIDRRSVALVAAAPYLFPAALYLWIGEYHVHYTIAWLAAMLGLVLPDALRRGWHAPPRWSIPLACWAGVIAVTAPIVVLRSTDFHLELLTRTRLPHEALGGLTYQSIGWVGHVALALVIGILWFDWLLSLDAPFFTRWVVTPFACGAFVLSAVSLYQMVRDITFLNPTVYASIHRATGTLFDANIAGALAAMWVGGWIAFALAAGRPVLIAIPGVLLAWAAVWASASRTALGSALVVTLFGALAVLKPLVKRPRLLAGLLVVALFIAAGAVVALSRSEAAAGPAARLRGMVTLATTSPRQLAQTLWDRDGYGVAANRMIARYPLFGVGVGAFHEMAPEFAGSLPADNAQNWFRHQLAEIGLVGSVGWIFFVVSFAWWILRVRRGEPTTIWAVRGMLIALVLVSLVGMPGQDPAVAITFWTVAAWAVTIVGSPPSRGTSATPWVAAMVIVLAAGIGTAQLAAGRLRLPVRIQHAISGDYAEYSYGFWSAEQDDQGEFRWAKTRATTVIHADGKVMRLTTAVNFPDVSEHPTHVKAWVDGRLVIDGELTGEAPSITQQVPIPPGEQRVLIETWADRSVVAPPPDGRELALQVRWRFVSGT
jgi:hypothetical protein